VNEKDGIYVPFVLLERERQRERERERERERDRERRCIVQAIRQTYFIYIIFIIDIRVCEHVTCMCRILKNLGVCVKGNSMIHEGRKKTRKPVKRAPPYRRSGSTSL